MSTDSPVDAEVAVVGAGVVGCAVALALARRGVSVSLLEAESEPGLGASGTNSGILHTGFDSTPGELETRLIRRAAALREQVIGVLGIPVLRCGAVMWTGDESVAAGIAAVARANGEPVVQRDRGTLEIPGEAVTDPVAYTLALAAAARRHGAHLHTRFRVTGIDLPGDRLTLHSGSQTVRCHVAVNCAGLWADAIASLAGDNSFSVYPRKGEFVVFDPPAGEPLQRIILPVPTKRTKGVLVFPTLDGKVIAGPTAVDLEDKDDWSVRPGARDEILPQARAIYPALVDASPIAMYAGLRPAGRGVNYVVGVSRACHRLVNVAAIRSTGLSASLGIAEHVCEIVSTVGVSVGPELPLETGAPVQSTGPWWRRTAEYRAR
jgi:glycerol-3-phosphate dehydrogenase